MKRRAELESRLKSLDNKIKKPERSFLDFASINPLQHPEKPADLIELNAIKDQRFSCIKEMFEMDHYHQSSRVSVLQPATVVQVDEQIKNAEWAGIGGLVAFATTVVGLRLTFTILALRR
ncbi:hypothetical protein FRUB_06230 [Fimbriiglobus ruber]|uniref:Uncharacterized protein n=1 Tax=Fimbriiglobus ruber TaxID=1908690 RepID=A0A225DKN9_9BACT|nr:hypothetical protein FRUB_06230 [Fimbriiglobus ruber]